MVIDYRDGRRAVAAQRALAAAGVAAVYVPETLIAVPDDPTATQWVVHRLTVPPADAARAAAVLDAHGLLDGPDGGESPRPA